MLTAHGLRSVAWRIDETGITRGRALLVAEGALTPALRAGADRDLEGDLTLRPFEQIERHVDPAERRTLRRSSATSAGRAA